MQRSGSHPVPPADREGRGGRAELSSQLASDDLAPLPLLPTHPLRLVPARGTNDRKRPVICSQRPTAPGEDCTRACPSKRAHVDEQQSCGSSDSRRPGKRRHVEPRSAKQPFARGFACALAVSPDRRDHAEGRCDGASDDEDNDPRPSALRAGGLFTSEAGKQQDEPREGCECDSSERSIRRGCNPPRIASSLRHAKSR